ILRDELRDVVQIGVPPAQLGIAPPHLRADVILREIERDMLGFGNEAGAEPVDFPFDMDPLDGGHNDDALPPFNNDEEFRLAALFNGVERARFAADWHAPHLEDIAAERWRPFEDADWRWLHNVDEGQDNDADWQRLLRALPIPGRNPPPVPVDQGAVPMQLPVNEAAVGQARPEGAEVFVNPYDAVPRWPGVDRLAGDDADAGRGRGENLGVWGAEWWRHP
ncbi:hypothetical protein LTS18_013147, partial [Coniosporium uncinatum]